MTSYRNSTATGAGSQCETDSTKISRVCHGIILSMRENSGTKLHRCYMGIDKKQYPKWVGWAIISRHKQNGTNIKAIADPCLDAAVLSWYYLRYLETQSSS